MYLLLFSRIASRCQFPGNNRRIPLISDKNHLRVSEEGEFKLHEIKSKKIIVILFRLQQVPNC